MAFSDRPTVADIAADPRAVLARFRGRRPFPFSIGDEQPEAVLLSVDQFDELDGGERFDYRPGVLTPEEFAEQLAGFVAEIRAGSFVPVVWGDGDGDDDAMIMSTAQYRDLRGDDHPPTGVPDDPTRRVYASEPLPTSRPMTMDQIAEMMGPETTELLRKIRAEREADSGSDEWLSSYRASGRGGRARMRRGGVSRASREVRAHT